MTKNKTNLNFHQTFKPEKKHLCSLLNEIENCTNLSAEGISHKTGIPTGKSSGKVEPTITYLEYMGLITKESSKGIYNISRTATGDCVNFEDPGLGEELTLLLMHSMLTRPERGAELWSFIINHIMPRYHNCIGKDYLEAELRNEYGKDVNLSPFNGSYTGLFGNLALINIETDSYEFCPHVYNSEFIYLYALILYEYWDIWFDVKETEGSKSLEEVTSLQLDDIGFKNPFGWDSIKEYDALEQLDRAGVISLNCQMSPFTVRRVMDKDEIIDVLYSNLC